MSRLKAFGTFLLHHWWMTLILLIVVAVFAAAPFRALYRAVASRVGFLPAPRDAA